MTESTLPSPRSRLAALIAEARRRGRRRNLALAIALLALLFGVGIWARLELTGGGGGAAAVQAPPGFHVVQSQGPVARRVLELWTHSQPVSVDLATGKGRPVRTTSAIWYDGRGNVNRVVTRADGRVQHDDAFVCPVRLPDRAFRGPSPSRITGRWTGPGIRGSPASGPSTAAPSSGSRRGRLGGSQRLRTSASGSASTRVRTSPSPTVCTKTARSSSEALVLERKPDIAAGKYAFVVPNPTKGAFRTNPTPELSARGSNPTLSGRAARSDRGRSGLASASVAIVWRRSRSGRPSSPPQASARRRQRTSSTTTETSGSANSMPATCTGPGELLFLVA